MSEETQADRDERKWSEGYRAAWKGMLAESIRHLRGEGVDLNAAAMLLEREEALVTLRDVCGQFGDNDWPNNLHLSDIIEKHLARNLRANR